MRYFTNANDYGNYSAEIHWASASKNTDYYIYSSNHNRHESAVSQFFATSTSTFLQVANGDRLKFHTTSTKSAQYWLRVQIVCIGCTAAKI